MIRRLVHQQYVGLAKEHARHRDAHLPSAGQQANVAVDPLVIETKAVQHFARGGFETIAAEMVVLLLHFSEAGEDAIHVVGLSRIGHRSLQPFELVMKIAQTATACDRLVQNRASRHLLHVLAEVADRQLLRNRHLPFVRHLFARDHPEQSRLPCPIRANQADLLPWIELEGCVNEQDLPAVVLVDAGEGNHNRSSPRATRTASPPTFTSLITGPTEPSGSWASSVTVIEMWTWLARPIATPW